MFVRKLTELIQCQGFFLLHRAEIVFILNTAGHDDCYRYQVLNDRSRAAGVPRGHVLRCDQRDIPSYRWYRFTGASGNEMPTKCVPEHRCGTHAPGWLSTPHPTRMGQIINGKVCFRWRGRCCHWSANIWIKRCNGYYIYKLGRTPVCHLRYCGNGGFGKFGLVFFYFQCLFAPNYGHTNMMILAKRSLKC